MSALPSYGSGYYRQILYEEVSHLLCIIVADFSGHSLGADKGL